MTKIKNIRLKQPDHDGYADVVEQVFAGKEWPDVIWLDAPYYATYAKKGYLWDMTRAWDQSDLVGSGRVKDETPVNTMRINNKLYGFTPARGGGCVTYIKTAWLERLGLKVPETYAEFLQVCDAFTNGDPDGNGINGDTCAVAAPGLVAEEAPYTNYLPEFYQNARYSFYKKSDGTWVDGFTEDSMRDALLRLTDAYSKGYIGKETLVNGTDDCRNDFYNEKFGIFTYWDGVWATNLKENLEAKGHDGRLSAIAPLKDCGSYIERVPPAYCITAKCKDPEAVFKYFLEPILDGSTIQFLWSYGSENVHWSKKAETVLGKTYKDGELHMLESKKYPGTSYTVANLDPMSSIAKIDKMDNPIYLVEAPEAVTSSDLFYNHSQIDSLIPETDAVQMYSANLDALKYKLILNVVTGKYSIDGAMNRFQSSGGQKWSQLIVDSLNKR